MENTEELLDLPIEELFARLRTSQTGLTSQEAEERLKIFGYNELVKKKRRTGIENFFLRFENPLIILLLIAGLISAFFGEVLNSVIIFSIVILSINLDFFQESKAEKAAEILKEKVSTTATLLRDGIKKEVRFFEIVPGDIVYLSAGDMIPADARVISARDFFVNQSALTGESFPVEKRPATLKVRKKVISEWTNYLFMGTSVVSGTAIGLIIRTGSSSEYGKIARKLIARGAETEFDKGIKKFGFLIMKVIFLLVIFVFFINALIKGDVLNSLLFSLALAVGLTPDLLPMIISINLSKGALGMSKKGVIVKHLASIHNFGSMDVLCSDKTGTLTENKIVLVLHINMKGKDDDKVLLYSFLNSYYQTGLKSPLDNAILNHTEIQITEYQKIDEVPFDFTRKRVSIVVEYEKKRLLITKGAPEEIIKVCSFYELDNDVNELTNELKRKIERRYNNLSSEGFRVLGVSYKILTDKKEIYTINDENDVVFLGYVAFVDPPKQSAKKSIELLKKAGIELKILTGDNELVTKMVCRKLNFQIKGIVLGDEIAQLDNDALIKVAMEANIFARVTPGQKDRIINALKSIGHVVGYLGDGINDAPSMRTADVSISVENAVDVAKESADIILLTKDLMVLSEGIIEGRKTFGNTMKYVMMGTSSNFGNMISVAGASMFLPFLPMLPIQILLNNLLYDMSESTIPTDNVDHEYIEKPKKWDISFIKKFMLVLGPVSSIFDFLTFFIMLSVFNATEPLFQTGWFIESIFTQSLVIFVIRTRKTPFYKSKPSKALLYSTLIVLGFALLLPFSPLGVLFHLIILPLNFFIFLALLVGVYMILVEIVKKWFYKRYANRLDQIKI